jgi:O-antigen/teichoic acid export membrane protein
MSDQILTPNPTTAATGYSSFSQSGQHLFDGTIRLFLAEALILPTGILTAAFLTRRLGPDDYGLFTIAAMMVVWIQTSITTFFSRPTFKLIAEAKDWKPLAATLVRFHLIVSVAAACLLWLLSGSLGSLLQEPTLVTYLRLFAFDIPIFSLAHAHRNILIGIGAFRQRAWSSAGRWVARLLLIVLLVELGLSVQGAILGSIGASLIELAIVRFYVRPPLLSGIGIHLQGFWDYAWPLFFFSISVALFSKLDLLMLKMLGGTAGEAGIYGAAQNLSIIPGIFAASFSPLLLSTLSRLISGGDVASAKVIASDAMRLATVLLPFAAMTAGMAHEIVDLIFGPLYLQAAPLLSVLIFGALAMVMISVATVILIAAGKPKWTLACAVPLLPLAVIGHVLLIPLFGAMGAALVTTFLTGLGALAAALSVYRLWRILPPLATLGRSSVICGAAFILASFWSAPGILLFLKVPAVAILILGLFALLGEFTVGEIALARSAFDWRAAPERNPS